ncbi:hypothetical protein J1N35_042073 [Gossypium stocksii]|uniref:Uncharacterized protein n=1 Tax=Gossypium stocksii TaxID=47602 RepID=A0A9D3ZJ74_9ROSI|nr:hypothetical protein J1N35_042073 [Gossypium stocksii]
MGLVIVELNMKDKVGGQEKQKGNGVCMGLEERLDIQKKLILGEAKKAWEVGKRLGFSIRGDDHEVVDEIMRLEPGGAVEM